MSKIIVYASRYGSTKRYADKLSELTGVEAVDYSKVKDISAYAVSRTVLATYGQRIDYVDLSALDVIVPSV